jgi:hypothetical protein
MDVEDQLFPIFAENFDKFLALLHPDNCSVLEDDLDRFVLKCGKGC